MDPVRNPFAPGAGTPPPELVGREGLSEHIRIALERTKRGLPAKSLIAVGLRGVGKTVLLNRVQIQAEELGLLPIYIEAQEKHPLSRLLTAELRKAILTLDRLGAVNEHVKRALRVFAGWIGSLKLSFGEMSVALDIDPEPGMADSGVPEVDLPDMFVALGRAALARGRAVVLIVDELQYLTASDLGALIMALHRTAQLGLPVVMAGAGLPLIVGLSGEAKSYAERLFEFPTLSALGHADAVRALAIPTLREGIMFAPEAIEAVLSATAGYPYFLQEWGYHAWNVSVGPTISAPDVAVAEQRALARLDSGFFRVRFDRLTPAEKDYLRAMAALGPGPHRSGDIARSLHKATTNFGPRREALIRKGMIWSPSHGDTAFTVPLFDQFLLRTIPDWSTTPHAHSKPKA